MVGYGKKIIIIIIKSRAPIGRTRWEHRVLYNNNKMSLNETLTEKLTIRHNFSPGSKQKLTSELLIGLSSLICCSYSGLFFFSFFFLKAALDSQQTGPWVSVQI